ncbi:hypothetical protein GWK47_027230 [Chionoecetes opilio]|uniref:Ig-like domain-containing protein n=1 Tax=Chionoecetes opilio TaxID=41210 RepID=A0A8J8WCS1_CHIOP|nr:hypothetical protein GWK47_027230 [Chionoecetes opilio]
MLADIKYLSYPTRRGNEVESPGQSYGGVSGLQVGPVRLPDNNTYISYGLNPSANNSLIECVYELDEGEQVARVFWEMGDGGNDTYEWSPGTIGRATGKLEGMVELDRDDGSLELTKLSYDLSNTYSCGVDLTSGTTMSSDKEEVIIIDTSASSTHTSHNHNCIYTASYESPAVFPEPTLSAGMFSSELNRFYEEVPSSKWFKIKHTNDSVTYTYQNVSFKIDQNTPEDIVFKLRLGVTKSDGQYISLFGYISNSSSWSEHGCPDVRGGDNTDVLYFPGSSAVCRGGRQDSTRATVVCKKGYEHEGDVRIVVMLCNGTSLTWRPQEGRTATPEDLVCVTTNGGGGTESGSPSLTVPSLTLLGIALLTFCRL